MTPAVVVRQDLRVRLAGGGHPDRPHLAHPDPVAEPGAAEHERVPVARHLEQRRLEPAEQPADVQITRDLDAALVTLDRQHADPPRRAALPRHPPPPAPAAPRARATSRRTPPISGCSVAPRAVSSACDSFSVQRNFALPSRGRLHPPSRSPPRKLPMFSSG